ncbi:MAG: hypothetical protein AAFY59_10940 [Pseudomonadota bacterium]
MKRVLLIAALTAPGLAHAACPVADDLMGGIYVTDDEGSVTLFLADGQDIIERTQYADSTEGFAYRTALGLLILTYAETEDGEPVAGSGETYSYSRDPYGLTVPENGVWQARITTTYEDGTDAEFENYTLSAGQRGETTIGACTYASVPVAHISLFLSRGEISAFMQDYLPDLGIAVATGYWDPEAGFERYENTAISTTPPASGQ